MPKFFTARENISENNIIINNEDVAHITKVLRLKCGDEITVCDGQGYDYKAVIDEIAPKEIICSITEKKKCETEPNIEVTLFQGIPKAAKMDNIIQKTTELGISRIVPVMLDRCVVKLENSKAEAKKQERWQKIANEAAKQSGRGVVPEIMMPVNLDTAIRMASELDLCFAPYECEEQKRLKEVLTSKFDIKSVGFIIGPEGGFDVFPFHGRELRSARK